MALAGSFHGSPVSSLGLDRRHTPRLIRPGEANDEYNVCHGTPPLSRQPSLMLARHDSRSMTAWTKALTSRPTAP